MKLESPKMKKNNQGISPLYIVIAVVTVLSLTVGGYFIYKNQQRKEYVTKIEKLDKELEDLLDKDNYFTLRNGEVVPRTQSDLNDLFEKIEKNIKEFEKNTELLSKKMEDVKCNVGRNTILQNRFIDTAKRNLTGTGGTSTKFYKDDFAKNFDDNLEDLRTDFRRGCSDFYEENGIEFND